MQIEEQPEKSLLEMDDDNSTCKQESENVQEDTVVINNQTELVDISEESIHSDMDLDDEEMDAT